MLKINKALIEKNKALIGKKIRRNGVIKWEKVLKKWKR